jgi:hypothetical protein
MEPKINIGEVTITEYNLIVKQLAVGQLGECIDLFMRLREIGVKAQQEMQAQQESKILPPPAA